MVFDLQGIAFAVEMAFHAIRLAPPPRSLSRQNLLAEERERKRGHNEQLHAEARSWMAYRPSLSPKGDQYTRED